MTEKKRTAYQREMDQVHLSREKADETLRMMLEENRRLRTQEAERGRKKKISRRITILAGGAAAAALLIATGLNTNTGGGHIGTAGLDTLPVSQVQSMSTVQTDGGEFSAAAQEALFPGWTVTGGSTEEHSRDGQTAHGITLFLEKGEKKLRAVITDYEPDEHPAAQEERQIAGKNVRLASDAESGETTAAYRQDGMYITLYGQMPEEEFADTVKEILEQNR